MKLGLAVARAIIGLLFVGHGTQKLFGWFGGPGLQGTAQFFESIGLRPGKRHALTAGTAETVGGALIATGFLTPLASALVTGAMSQAIRSVHGPKGLWSTEGGYEYNLVIIAGLFALTDVGPGDWSLDRALGTERCGPLWALAALGAGLAGPALLVRGGEEQPPQPAPAPAEVAPAAA